MLERQVDEVRRPACPMWFDQPTILVPPTQTHTQRYLEQLVTF